MVMAVQWAAWLWGASGRQRAASNASAGVLLSHLLLLLLLLLLLSHLLLPSHLLVLLVLLTAGAGAGAAAGAAATMSIHTPHTAPACGSYFKWTLAVALVVTEGVALCQPPQR
jgi:hypothetical protein